MVVIKGTEVLRQHIELPPCCTERPPVYAVAMSGAENIWPSLVNLCVYGICSYMVAKLELIVMCSTLAHETYHSLIVGCCHLLPPYQSDLP